MSRPTERIGEVLPDPFAYPPEAHQRRHGPAGYLNYQAYKPWLRDEFAFRCVYCHFREAWYPDRQGSFSVDHVEPQVTAPDRIRDYANMVYACTAWNSAKQEHEVLDPTATPFGHHLRVLDDGSIEALTVKAQDLIDRLGLADESLARVRRYYLDLIALKREYHDDARVHSLFMRSFGYPDDLPDLPKLRPPGGNLRQGNASSCFLRRRAEGTLSPYY